MTTKSEASVAVPVPAPNRYIPGKSDRAGLHLWPALALASLLLFNFFFTKNFFAVEFRDGHFYGSLVDVFHRGGPVALLSLGMTLVIATGGVDLSVGAICAIAGAVLAVRSGGHPDAGIAGPLAAALLVGIGAGVLNGFLVAVLELQPIIATLVLMIAGRGVAQLLTDGQILAIDAPGLRAIGNGFFASIPDGVWLVLAAFVAIAAFTRRTAFGLFVEALGNGGTAGRYAGLPTTGIRLAVYGLSGLFAAGAGILIATDIGAADANNAGLYLELDAILAVVLGGTALAGGRFSFAGSLLGTLIIQTLTTTINTRGVAVEYTLVIKALVVIGLCLAQSPEFRARIRGRR